MNRANCQRINLEENQLNLTLLIEERELVLTSAKAGERIRLIERNSKKLQPIRNSNSNSNLEHSTKVSLIANKGD